MIALNDVQLKTLMTAAAGMSRYHPDPMAALSCWQRSVINPVSFFWQRLRCGYAFMA